MAYLEKIKKDYNDGIISFQKLKTMEESYKSSNEKEKIELRYEEYEKKLVIRNIYNNVRAIKNNVQFFFWFFIISSILFIIFSILF